MIPELLPCPFCNGEARIDEGQRVGTHDSGWRWVRCRVCLASSGGYNLGNVAETIDAAIKGWNRRMPQP